MAPRRSLTALLCAAAPLASTAAGSWVGWLRGAVGDIAAAEPIGEAAPASAPPAAEQWDALRQLLQKWEFTQNYAIAVGTAEHGRLFLYEGGHFKMHTKIPTGSTSKWPSAMMFAGLVNDGTIKSLDDPISKYLTWWTSDPKDARSQVTFRMLLSFTSGFGGGHPGQEANTRAARAWRNASGAQWANLTLEETLAADIGKEGSTKCNMLWGDITECARSIYENVKLSGTPGKVYAYNSYHLQLAAAVAVATTGLDIHAVIRKYLFEPYKMKHSSYLGKCPDFSAGLVTTGEDYENFLAGLLDYKVLSKEIVDASEEDATPFMSDFYTLYGDYGFGHFLFCFDSVDGMTEECKRSRVHADPGAFGFIPLIDRKNGYYMELVSAEIPPLGNYAKSGIPEYLAVAVKPHVDAILGGKTEVAKHMTHSPELLSLSIADVNYCLNCVLHPLKCLV